MEAFSITVTAGGTVSVNEYGVGCHRGDMLNAHIETAVWSMTCALDYVVDGQRWKAEAEVDELMDKLRPLVLARLEKCDGIDSE